MGYATGIGSALQGIFINVMRINITQYELLFSLYSWPSVFLVVIGGVLIDRVLGLRFGVIIFSALASVGQLLFAIGGYLNLYWLLCVGSFVLGAGGELGGTAMEVFVAALFRDRELSFVFGILYGAGRLSSVLTLNFNTRLYDALHFITDHHVKLGSLFLFGFGLTIVKVLTVVLVGVLDYKRDKLLRKRKNEERRKFSLKDIRHFSLSYWLFVCMGTLYYIPVFQFTTIAQVFFQKKYGYKIEIANLVNSIVFVVTAIAYPTLGFLFDWTGYKLFWGMFAALGTMSCHLVFAFAGPQYFVPIVTSLFLGLFYAMFTISVWPQVFLLIPTHQLGTAYGILSASYELGQAVSPIITGQIADHSGYMVVELFFASVLSITLALLVVLYITPKGQMLNMSGRQKRRMLAGQTDAVEYSQQTNRASLKTSIILEKLASECNDETSPPLSDTETSQLTVEADRACSEENS